MEEQFSKNRINGKELGVRSKGAITLLSCISFVSTLILILSHLGIITSSTENAYYSQNRPTHKHFATTYNNFSKTITMEGIDIRLKSPVTAMIAGPTGSGKTMLLFELITRSSMFFVTQPTQIIYCYGVWQEKFSEIEDKVTFNEGMIDVENEIPKDGKNRWLIIDDLMSETSGKKDMNTLYTKFSHHLNISVFFVVQNLFVKENRTLSLNSHYFFLFKNPRDSVGITNLAKQAFPGNVKFVQEAYRDATKQPYSFLLLDLRQETDERMRLIGNFLQTDGTPPIAYVSKQ